MNHKLLLAIKSDEVLEKTWNSISLAGYRGSVSHGTAGDILDDIDICGVFLAPPSHYFGLTKFEHVERIGVDGMYDFTLFEIRKYFKLLLSANPNVLPLLWLPENMYLVRADWADWLIENRMLFMTKMLYKSYGGYAHGQAQRMTHVCTAGAFQGSKRRKRFEKFGYDCKNASHVIRLLRMGIEALTMGEINVVRHDAKVLKAIKAGQWSLLEVRYEIDRLQNLLDEALVRCGLPDKPDMEKVEGVLIDIVRAGLNK